MPGAEDWAFPEDLRPKQGDVAFDLEAALDAVVELRAHVPPHAFTAGILGTERAGNGVVIGADGLVLTIGYLIVEAHAIWIATRRGAVLAGHALAYDHASGFGLVLALGELGLAPLARGSAAACPVGAEVFLLGAGGVAHALRARVFARREFAGYWEYVLDDAIFTAPAHPQWGGAALVARDGRLAGIGSLLVQELHGGRLVQGNMIVPIDLLEPILDDLVRYGRPRRAPRPWLGMYVQEVDGALVVGGLVAGGPAERAGVKLGDAVLAVAGERPAGLADLFRRIWALGPAGTEIPLTLGRGAKRLDVRAVSADRNDFLLKPRLH
ncbi:MAG: S1C family serine protease [Burkholderiales bacterium]|nr:S1C family serine protease [Burkholderiales bacterium]